MQKVVLKLDLHDDKDKKKALKIVSGFEGVDSMSIDMKEKKLTVTGAVDPVELVGKLRKQIAADIVSVGPAKDSPPKKDDGKKDEGDKKKDGKDQLPYFLMPYPQPQYYYGHMRSVEEDQNSCVIC